MLHIYKDPPELESKLKRVLSVVLAHDTLIFWADGVLNVYEHQELLQSYRYVVLENDIKARGLPNPGSGRTISMAQLVDLIAQDLSAPISW